MDVRAENGAYGLCWLSWRYNRENLYFLILYDSSNDKNTYELFASHHSHATAYGLCRIVFWYVWAENRAYGLCRIVLWYNRAKLYFTWPYMIVLMILNTSEMSALHLSRATAIFDVGCCQFGPSWMFGLKMELTACADLVGGTTEESSIFHDLIR